MSGVTQLLSQAFCQALCSDIKIGEHPDGNVWMVHANLLPLQVAAKIILSTKRCPLISPNRPDGHIEFSLVPYALPDRFKKDVCEQKEVPSSLFWQAIESKKSHYVEQHNVDFEGKTLGKSTEEFKNEMIERCDQINPLLLELVEHIPKGLAIDLGCGRGAHSFYLLSKEWKVMAMDFSPKSQELVTQELTNEKEEAKSRFTFIQGDITTMEFPEKQVDLIVCQDVLPYISPKKLKSLMAKIHHALMPQGRFVGTFFFQPQEDVKHIVPFMERAAGAHFYPEEYLGQALLTHTGFELEEGVVRQTSGFPRSCFQFVARKI